jgi:hypothetical protein
MLNEQQLARALRVALQPAADSEPSRDLWPSIVERTNRSARWSIADWGAVALIAVGLIFFPEWFWFLGYHL